MKILIVAVLMLATPFAFADELDDLRKQQATMNTALETTSEMIMQAAKQAREASEAIAAAGCDVAKQDQCILTDDTKSAVETSYGSYAAAQAQLANLETAVENLNANLTANRERQEALIASNTDRQPAEVIPALVKLNLIQGIELDVMNKWNETEGKWNDLESDMDDLERKMDNSLIGQYFQDKMGQFVNSSLACKMRKRCVTKERAEVDNKYLEELFPGMSKTRRSSTKFYDKTKNRRGGNQ